MFNFKYFILWIYFAVNLMTFLENQALAQESYQESDQEAISSPQNLNPQKAPGLSLEEKKTEAAKESGRLWFELLYGLTLNRNLSAAVQSNLFGPTQMSFFWEASSKRTIQWGLSYEFMPVNWLKSPRVLLDGSESLGPLEKTTALIHGGGLVLRAAYELPFQMRFFWKDHFVRRRLSFPDQKGALQTWAMTLSLGLSKKLPALGILESSEVVAQLSWQWNQFTYLKLLKESYEQVDLQLYPWTLQVGWRVALF